MEKTENINVRVDDDLVERVDDVSDRYEMDRSKLIRLMIRNGLDVVEHDGLDALLEQGEADPDADEEAPPA